MTESTSYINIHTHQKSDVNARIEIVNVMAPGQPPDDSLFSVALHPWQIADNPRRDVLKVLRPYRERPNLVAIGEAGIDKAIDVALDLQKKVFSDQVALSEEWRLPLIIHAVRSSNELIEINRGLKPAMPWIIHGFNGRPSILENYLRQGFFMSFGKALIRPNPTLVAALRFCPDEHLFLETDDSKFSIAEIYRAAAVIRQTEPESLKEVIYRNFVRLFGEICRWSVGI